MPPGKDPFALVLLGKDPFALVLLGKNLFMLVPPDEDNSLSSRNILYKDREY